MARIAGYPVQLYRDGSRGVMEYTLSPPTLDEPFRDTVHGELY
jgi:hypothetical protein